MEKPDRRTLFRVSTACLCFTACTILIGTLHCYYAWGGGNGGFWLKTPGYHRLTYFLLVLGYVSAMFGFRCGHWIHRVIALFFMYLLFCVLFNLGLYQNLH